MPPPRFVDGTAALGLPEIDAQRVVLADLNGDGRPDLVVRALRAGEGGADGYRVFLNRAVTTGNSRGTSTSARFLELDKPSGLPGPRGGDCLVFADMDNDGRADAIFARNLDVHNKDFKEPEAPARTCILRGRGDGTFEPLLLIEAAKAATTTCVAVGDRNSDGWLDVWLGNWYTRYGTSNEAFTSDLLVQERSEAAVAPGSKAWPFVKSALPEDAEAFSEEADAAGRPMYGAMMVRLWRPRSTINPFPPAGWYVHLLALNYGRRANRLWSPVFHWCGTGLRPEHHWTDAGAERGLDGDAIRHGQYPAWLKARAKTDKRFDRADEKPYRAHGNTFDAAIGDIDNDGDFDLFVSEITHAWAGESSDRSRFLVNMAVESRVENPRFEASARLSVDRVPPVPAEDEWNKPPLGTAEKPWVPRWNQGDLFCELADLDHDGRLDLILSSSDYPDPAPFDQRLRVFHQQPDGTFADTTASSGIDHVGAQQLSLGDIDGDGDLDIVVGQSYNRFDAGLVGATNTRQGSSGPRMRVFLNQTADERAKAGRGARSGLGGNSLVLCLRGHSGVPKVSQGQMAGRSSRDALGAIVRVTATIGGRSVTQLRQLVGIGGCAGKQHEFIVHVGLGDAREAERVEVIWPTWNERTTVRHRLAAGRHTLEIEPTAQP